MYVCMYVCMCVCVCVCASEYSHTQVLNYITMHTKVAYSININVEECGVISIGEMLDVFM